MNAQIKDLAKILDKINSDTRFRENVRFDRVEYSEEAGELEAFFKTSSHLPPAQFLKLKKEILASCGAGVGVMLDQSDFKDEFCRADDMI